MRDIAFESLQQLGTRIIFIDQAHVLAQTTRSSRSTKGALETTASEVLRDLMDETGIALVFLASSGFSGLEAVDESLADRVSVRLRLQHFEDDPLWQPRWSRSMRVPRSSTDRICRLRSIASVACRARR